MYRCIRLSGSCFCVLSSALCHVHSSTKGPQAYAGLHLVRLHRPLERRLDPLVGAPARAPPSELFFTTTYCSTHAHQDRLPICVAQFLNRCLTVCGARDFFISANVWTHTLEIQLYSDQSLHGYSEVLASTPLSSAARDVHSSTWTYSWYCSQRPRR